MNPEESDVFLYALPALAMAVGEAELSHSRQTNIGHLALALLQHPSVQSRTGAISLPPLEDLRVAFRDVRGTTVEDLARKEQQGTVTVITSIDGVPQPDIDVMGALSTRANSTINEDLVPVRLLERVVGEDTEVSGILSRLGVDLDALRALLRDALSS